MNTKNLLLLLWIAVLLVTSSCRKESIVDFSTNNSMDAGQDTLLLSSNSAMNIALYSIAQELAVLIKQEPIRILLKNEIGKQFDGDYEVLLKDLKEKVTTEGKSFQSYFNDRNQQAVDNLLKQIPNLQLSIPVNYESWNEKSFVIPVTYVPVCEDPERLTSVEVYYSDGKKQSFSLIEKPSIPILVIGYCERVDANGELQSNLISNTASSTNKTAETTKYAYLKRIRLDNLSEPWISGAAELYLSVREKGEYGDPNYAVSSYYEVYHDASIERDKEGLWTGDKLWTLYPTEGSAISWGYSVSAYNEAYYFWIEYDNYPLTLAPWPTSQTYSVNVSGNTYFIFGTDISDYLGYNYVATSIINDYTYGDPLILDSSTGDVRYSVYEN